MDFIVIFFSLLVIGGVVAIVLSIPSKSPEQTPTLQEKIEGTDFTPSQMFMGSDGKSGIAVNEQQQQLCLINALSSRPRRISCSQLVGSLMVKNGEILEQGLRSAPDGIVNFHEGLQRKLQHHVHNLNHDPTGRSNQRIDLIVIIHDQDDPFHTVNMLDMDTKIGGILFEKAMSTARHWHSVLDGLLLQADRFVQVQEEEISQPPPSTEALETELKRLHNLVEQNILTQEEFNLHKDKLLAAKS